MASDEIESLIAEWDQETVQKAFALQAKIKREGLDGIQFLHDEGQGQSAEKTMNDEGDEITKSTIESVMDSSY